MSLYSEFFEQHRNGKKHADKVRKIAEGASGTTSVLKCDICNITVTSSALMETHLKGKKHLKALGGSAPDGTAAKPAEPITCDVCKLTVHSQQLMDAHLLGKKHLKAASGDAKGSEQITCDTCNVSVPGQEAMDAHVQGKKHRSKLSGGLSGPILPFTESLYCNVCRFVLRWKRFQLRAFPSRNHDSTF